MTETRLRFPPSPTGYLHIGGARTALYNWLYAKQTGGKLILRIEDTDTDRSNQESIQGILDGLEWLGIDFDEGPYFQTDFSEEHIAAAQKLLNEELAYKCFCTKEELDSKREAALAAKKPLGYDRTCRRGFRIRNDRTRRQMFRMRQLCSGMSGQCRGRPTRCRNWTGTNK